MIEEKNSNNTAPAPLPSSASSTTTTTTTTTTLSDVEEYTSSSGIRRLRKLKKIEASRYAPIDESTTTFSRQLGAEGRMRIVSVSSKENRKETPEAVEVYLVEDCETKKKFYLKKVNDRGFAVIEVLAQEFSRALMPLHPVTCAVKNRNGYYILSEEKAPVIQMLGKNYEKEVYPKVNSGEWHGLVELAAIRYFLCDLDCNLKNVLLLTDLNQYIGIDGEWCFANAFATRKEENFVCAQFARGCAVIDRKKVRLHITLENLRTLPRLVPVTERDEIGFKPRRWFWDYGVMRASDQAYMAPRRAIATHSVNSNSTTTTTSTSTQTSSFSKIMVQSKPSNAHADRERFRGVLKILALSCYENLAKRIYQTRFGTLFSEGNDFEMYKRDVLTPINEGLRERYGDLLTAEKNWPEFLNYVNSQDAEEDFRLFCAGFNTFLSDYREAAKDERGSIILESIEEIRERLLQNDAPKLISVKAARLQPQQQPPLQDEVKLENRQLVEVAPPQVQNPVPAAAAENDVPPAQINPAEIQASLFSRLRAGCAAAVSKIRCCKSPSP
jgi:hypothetical protein